MSDDKPESQVWERGDEEAATQYRDAEGCYYRFVLSYRAEGEWDILDPWRRGGHGVDSTWPTYEAAAQHLRERGYAPMPQRKYGAKADRARELLAALDAGASTWNEFVDGLVPLMTRRAAPFVYRAIPKELRSRLYQPILERDPNNWIRGLGDQGFAEELMILADTQDIVWAAEGGTEDELRKAIARAREVAGDDVGANKWLDNYEPSSSTR